MYSYSLAQKTETDSTSSTNNQMCTQYKYTSEMIVLLLSTSIQCHYCSRLFSFFQRFLLSFVTYMYIVLVTCLCEWSRCLLHIMLDNIDSCHLGFSYRYKVRASWNIVSDPIYTCMQVRMCIHMDLLRKDYAF